WTNASGPCRSSASSSAGASSMDVIPGRGREPANPETLWSWGPGSLASLGLRDDGKCFAPPYPVLAHQLHQNALAQAAVGDAQALARKGTPDRLEDRAAGEHEVGALGADARVRDALGVARGDEMIEHAGNLGFRHPAAVDVAPLVARQLEMHAGDRRHGPGGAEQMRSFEAKTRAVRRRKRVDMARGLHHHCLV